MLLYLSEENAAGFQLARTSTGFTDLEQCLSTIKFLDHISTSADRAPSYGQLNMKGSMTKQDQPLRCKIIRDIIIIGKARDNVQQQAELDLH